MPKEQLNMPKRKLTRNQFFAVKRELQLTQRFQSDIAADYGVSASMVSLINRAGTWENYLAGKRAASLIRKAVKPQSPAQVTPKRPLNSDGHIDNELKNITAFQAEREITRLEDRIAMLTSGISGLYSNWLFNLLFGRSVRKGVENHVKRESVHGRN